MNIAQLKSFHKFRSARPFEAVATIAVVLSARICAVVLAPVHCVTKPEAKEMKLVCFLCRYQFYVGGHCGILKLHTPK